MAKSFFFVLDFDGTVTQKDVGNEICEAIDPQKYFSLQTAYRQNKLSLRDYQKQMWEDLPLSQNQMRELAMKNSALRSGVEDFLGFCAKSSYPVFIASCGIRDYIEPVLQKEIPIQLREIIQQVSCHEAEFHGERLTRLVFRDTEEVSSFWPFDKGRWCRELKNSFPDSICVGVGNGSSDRNFVGAVDQLFATDALAKYCQKEGVEYFHFETFHEITQCIRSL